MRDPIERVEAVIWRHYLTIECGTVQVDVLTTQDYLWYEIMCQGPGGRMWQGHARQLNGPPPEPEYWAVLVTEAGAPDATCVGDALPLVHVLRRLAGVLHRLCSDDAAPDALCSYTPSRQTV